MCHGTLLSYPPLHTGLLAVFQAPNKLLPQHFVCAVTSTDTHPIHPITSFRCLLKHHSSERLSSMSLYEQHPPPSHSYSPHHALLVLTPFTTSWHRHTCLLCLSQHTTQENVSSMRGHSTFVSVLVTALSQHLEHNRAGMLNSFSPGATSALQLPSKG